MSQNLRKRARFSVNSTNAGPLQAQRTMSWGPYSHSASFINPYYPQQNAIIQLPPSESVLINELGGNESLTNYQAGSCDTDLSAGLGGCQKVIEDGFYDNNGIFNITEEGSFVQLLAYRFTHYSDVPETSFVECLSCYIDMGAIKLNLSSPNIRPEVVIKQLQEEISFALICQQAISWPRFCMWSSVFAGTKFTRLACDCKPWMPQGNPVDESFINNAFSLFFQDGSIPPLINVTLTGMRQLTFSLNKDYLDYANETYGINSAQWFFQLMTPRTNGILDQGEVPMSSYVNTSLVDGYHGWFNRNPFTFGFGYRKFNSSANSSVYCDIYDLNNWTSTNFANTIGKDFSTQFNVIPYDASKPFFHINEFCKSRYLTPVVTANMPCSMSASRYYFLTSSYISTKQVRPFISTTASSGPTDTVGILWDNAIDGNIPRDITGDMGQSSGNVSMFIKEINPMFNLSRFNFLILDEWSTNTLNGGGYITNRTIQSVNNNTANVKDEAVYEAVYTALRSTATPPTDQNGTSINPIWDGIPYDLYSPYEPRWMTFTEDDHANGYNVQFDIRRYCRNRCLVNFSYKNNSAPFDDYTIPPEISTFKPYSIVVNQLWGQSTIEDGEEKPADKKVHFMRLISP